MAHSTRKTPPQSKPAVQPPQPSPDEQSGSAGPAAPPGAANHRKDSGQGRYGQTGVGNDVKETDGQSKYRRSEQDGDPSSKNESNEGSGRPDVDKTTKDIPKTG